MALRDLLTTKKGIMDPNGINASPRDAMRGHRYDILQWPVISEKANRLSETGTYTFFVSDKANKIEVKRAVAAQFGVDVVRVRLTHTPYKKVRRGRITGWKGGSKKVFVTLRPGQKIEIA